MGMNTKIKSKGAHTFCSKHWAIIGDSCSSVQNNHDEPKDLQEW